MKRLLFFIFLILVGLWAYLYLSNGPTTTESGMTYGVSFSQIRSANEKLPWKQVYGAILNDLGVKKLRLAAYWPLIEPRQGVYQFSDLDYQIDQARVHNTKVILAVGRRLPGWPECHDPIWLGKYDSDKQHELTSAFVKKIVERYKSNPAIEIWQLENEPFFELFTRSREVCPPLDTAAFQKEIDTVRSADPSRKILVTDGGELGTWSQAYQAGDIFGTSIYLYVWNQALGYMRYPILPGYFRVKHGLMRLIHGDKKAIVIELQSEPWIPRPLVEVPIDEQIQRFDLDQMNELISYSHDGGFDTVYLWGAEWWYWMKLHGHPEFWNRAKELY